MTKYAKIRSDVVVDVLDELATQVHPSLHGDYTAVPDGTEVGFVKDGRKWVAPTPVEPEPVAAPAPVPVLTKLAFLRRFTRAERIALREAAKTDPMVTDFMLLLDLATDVELTDADLIEGVTDLEAKGLLNAGRKDAILTAQP
jgi:hypothetical protein